MWELRHQAERIEEALEVMRARAERVTSYLTGMPHGGNGQDKMHVVDSLVDMQGKYKSLLERTYQRQDELEDLIDEIDNDLQRMLLRYRYVDMLPWPLVASKIGYSNSGMFYVHQRAVKAFRDIYNKKKSG